MGYGETTTSAQGARSSINTGGREPLDRNCANNLLQLARATFEVKENENNLYFADIVVWNDLLRHG
jgi:hypothetical protein